MAAKKKQGPRKAAKKPPAKKGKAATKKKAKPGPRQLHMKGVLDKKDEKLFNAAQRVKVARTRLARARDDFDTARLAVLKLMQKRKSKVYDDGDMRVFLDMKESVKVSESKGKVH
jgi:hypothetical protein